jgi:peptide-methionine (S)-S-oxide reductase
MRAALSRRGASATTTTKSAINRTMASTSPTNKRPLDPAAAASPPASGPGGGGSSSGPTPPRPSLLRGTRGAALAGVVACAGLFGWLTGGGGKGGDKPAGGGGGGGGGKWGDVLEAARKAKRGCPPSEPPPEGTEQIALASGCFWGSQLAMDRAPGVERTWVGYTQGDDPAPTYDSVCSAWGNPAHTEGVLCWYAKGADLGAILDEYLATMDPTTRNRQGGDRGPQYRSGIYYYTDAQRAVAERKLAEAAERARAGTGVTRSGRRWEGGSIAVELKPAAEFYIAEAYHQKYLEKGGRFGRAQSAEKGDKTPIRCYG